LKQDKKKYFICRYIKIIYIIYLLIYERFFKNNKIEICFIKPNKLAIFLEKCCSLFVRKHQNFHILNLNCDISQMKNEDGIPLLKASACDDLYEVIDKIPAMHSLDYLSDKLSAIKKDLILSIKQQVALDILDDLLMANVAHWLSTNKMSELYDKHPILLMDKKNYWTCLVLDYLKRKNVQYKIFHAMDFKKNKGILFLYYAIKLCVELAKAIVVTPKKNETLKDAKIGIPFYVFQNFTEYYDLKNYYLFWFEKSGIDPKKILIYIPTREINISDEEINNIKKAKFNIVFCPTRITRKRKCDVPIHRCSLKASSLLIQYLVQIIKIYKHSKNKSMKEQWKILALLLVQLPYWEDFFTKNNIKIKFRFHDIFSVRDIAAKLSGVITLSYHYSNHSELSVLHQDICDIFFVWGKRHQQCFSTENSAIKYLIQTGYMFDYTFAPKKRESIAIRGSFMKQNVSFIVGIFSENISFYLRKAQLEFYKKILDFAVQHPDVGIVVKPKKENDEMSLRSVEELNNVIEMLELQGRIIFLDRMKYPVEAGFASDIVVGTIPDSTAGLECALAGIPMVIYDCTHSGEKSHHLYNIGGYNKIIFGDIQYLLSAIDNIRKRPGSIPGFADWSFTLNITDPFRDGKANQRVAGYIKTLLLASNNGLSKGEVIEAANRAYAEEYGCDRVTSLH